MDHYTTTYSDIYGKETTTIQNDGEMLRVWLREVEFEGPDFDSLAPKGASPEQLARFTLNRGDLCSCSIACGIPVPVQVQDRLVNGELSVELVLGDPAPNGGIDREKVRIVLEYDGRQFAGPGTSGWFEVELLSIESQLPEGVYIKACFSCKYSGYSPGGYGLFGCMMCFRNLKSEYPKVTSISQFWSVHGRQDRFVQETYLCPEFKRRIPGTGYR